MFRERGTITVIIAYRRTITVIIEFRERGTITVIIAYTRV